MIYINEDHLTKIGVNWDETIDVIQDAVNCIRQSDFAQPIKPYLRYRNPGNRIIAMPAYVGGAVSMSGIKWIASFPENIKIGIPRAHSVVILNDADTGKPEAIINSPLLSVIRTASVSGFMIRNFYRGRKPDKIKLGITGFGPIGQWHLKMVDALLGDHLAEICLSDIKGIDGNLIPEKLKDKVTVADTWVEAYQDADIFITCTVSKEPYIDMMPKKGSLHLNVSLRDYKVEVYEFFKDSIVVDDWDEVCRENTDIENMHLKKGLQKSETISVAELASDETREKLNHGRPVLFNPMGMAAFDIAVGKYFLNKAESLGELVNLN